MALILNPDGFAQLSQPNEQLIDKKTEKSSTLDELSEGDDEVFPYSAGDEIATREEVANALESAIKKNDKLITKLTKYAQKKIIFYLGKNDERVLPVDIVAEAFNRILLLNRKWDKNKVPEIEKLVIMVIVSLIRIEAEKIKDRENPLYNPIEAGITETKKSSYNKRRLVPLFYQNENDSDNDNTVADVEKYKQRGSRKTEDDMDFESLDEEDYISQLESELENDEVAFFVLQARLDGTKSNIDIAEELGVEVKDVENALKRIKRKVKKITGLTNI